MLTRRSVLRGAGAAIALGATGCWGSFSLTRKVWSFNDDISDSKWVKWIIFLAFVLVPIYSIAIFVDAIVLNTIEFFSGSNPMRSKIEELPGGHRLAIERVNDSRVRLTLSKDGAPLHVFCIERIDRGFRLLSGDRAELTAIGELEREEGSIELRDARGVTIATLDDPAVRRATAKVRAGIGAREAVIASLRDV